MRQYPLTEKGVGPPGHTAMSSEVYFAQRRATQGGGLLDKLEQLCDAAGFAQLAGAGELVAVKLAFGEPGNTTYARPPIVARVLRKLTQYGMRPFLTDTVALPPSRRAHGLEVLAAAAAHGFGDAPVLVADGLKGLDATPVAIGGQHFEHVSVASALAQADGLLSVCHFTGHDATGFAGALYALGMGGASLEGKRRILEGTLDLAPEDASMLVQERLVEMFKGVVGPKKRQVGYVNLLLDLTPETDEQGWSDAAIAPDIGILASRDPVALDQACLDLLNQAPGLAGTRLSDPYAKDKLHALFPGIDYTRQLQVAESLGLGKRDYELMII